ncbi:uncharacterized protein LOC134285799 [Aedes albopictus]|uniref:FLYWCH-type domain-containing protein n=1 Tax=Aedes albopictus TaxID=7160 RepID=A0ABM1YTI9_AEDAL
MLMYNGYGFIKDRQTAKTCNWKCSLFRRMKCRGRAITKIADDPPSFRAAQFGYTQRGKMMLLYDGFAYIKDRDARNSCNWKCSVAGKRKCRARAVTKTALGRQMMKITNPNHNHDRKAYRFDTVNFFADKKSNYHLCIVLLSVSIDNYTAVDISM